MTQLRQYSGSGHPASRGEKEIWTDSALVDQIRAGNHRAFDTLFFSHYENLVAFTLIYVRARDVAEDLVQDLFHDIWRRGMAWHPRGSLRAFLYASARNKALEKQRQQRFRSGWFQDVDVDKSPTDEGPEADLHYKELQLHIHQAIEALPERRRQIFTMSRHQNLSYAEIAAVLGISINTVENQMVRALKFIRARVL